MSQSWHSQEENMPQPDMDNENPLDDARFDLERYLDEWWDKDDEFNQQETSNDDD